MSARRAPAAPPLKPNSLKQTFTCWVVLAKVLWGSVRPKITQKLLKPHATWRETVQNQSRTLGGFEGPTTEATGGTVICCHGCRSCLQRGNGVDVQVEKAWVAGGVRTSGILRSVPANTCFGHFAWRHFVLFMADTANGPGNEQADSLAEQGRLPHPYSELHDPKTPCGLQERDLWLRVGLDGNAVQMRVPTVWKL